MNWKNWKPRPGMAVRDPETGRQWRYLPAYDDLDRERWTSHKAFGAGGVHSILARLAPDMAICVPDEDGEALASVRRAIAAGPDRDDPVTVLGLLADLPTHRLISTEHPVRRGATAWRCLPTRSTFDVSCAMLDWHDTRTEAVVAAWQAVHGGEP